MKVTVKTQSGTTEYEADSWTVNDKAQLVVKSGDKEVAIYSAGNWLSAENS